MEKAKHSDSDLIDQLGGTIAVSKLCEVRPPSVTQWRTDGIPRARRMFLELKRPDIFSPPDGLA